jgi:hypothetical protein
MCARSPTMRGLPRKLSCAVAPSLAGILALVAWAGAGPAAEPVAGGGGIAGLQLASSSAQASASETAPPPPQVPVPSDGTGAAKGMQGELENPTGMPPGVVNGPCTPSSAHPFPVVLVHGTFANENFSWQTLAPVLSDAGYCVFGLNYGATQWTTYSGDHNYGVDYVENSAAELDSFVKSVVLPDTIEPDGEHATQVDIVGHSQGGMMPRYMIEHTSDSKYPGLGDSSLVHMLVGLAPSNHGADADGIVPLFQKLFGASAWTFPEGAGCGACGEQEAGSPFLNALNEEEAAPGVLYFVIESAFDEVVTPAPNAVTATLGEWPSAFLHGSSNEVLNVRLQDQCPTDTTEHLGIIYDPVAIADVVNALADNASVGGTPLSLPEPSCPAAVPPVLSG